MTLPFQIRTGLGHDTHRIEPGRPLRLGGVALESPFGLAGHSDADVLLHAVIDALLGAAGLDDIGTLFPDSDPDFLNIDSTKLLSEVARLVSSRNWTISNIDVILFAQEPKIAPYRSAIRNRLAELLSLPLDAVNIKAKTGEKLGFIGREEGISAAAIATLIRENSH
ncbi:MAG: 2-C-methyl-D-erythritol 2,4-cyclodiphosphate synthase [Planctomycetia bacterium]|nr:2-C-methyl-D-erythritol 2,4-cyclodiphosphate synthase [Planctomycetia bacterium]